jgi:hypothetical protein
LGDTDQKWLTSVENSTIVETAAETATAETETSFSVTEQPESLAEQDENFVSQNIQLPKERERYSVDGIDVSLIFNKYQQKAYEDAKVTAFSLKSNHTEILGLLSILLLKNTSDSSLVHEFGLNNLQS